MRQFVTSASSFYKRMDTWISLGRPQNIRRSLLLMLLITYKHHTRFSALIVGMLGILLAYMLVTILNNLADRKVDKLNKRKENLLLYIKDYKHEARTAFLCLGFIFCINILFVAGWLPKLLLLVLVMLGWAYSDKRISIQSRGLWATALLAACYVAIPYIIVATGAEVDLLVVRALVLCLFASSLLLAKDYKDEYGDRIVGKRTPLVRYGQNVTTLLAVVLCTLGFGLSLWLLDLYSSIIFYFIGISFLVCVVVIHRHRGSGAVLKALASVLFLGIVYISG